MSDSAPAPKRKAVKKVKSKTQKLREEGIAKRRKEAEIKQRCFDLYAAGWKQVRIAEELNISVHRICRWLQKANKTINKTVEDEPAPEPFEKNLEDVTASVVTDSRLNARDEEQQTLLEVAENQASPSDKYQAYVAASAIKMLRDNLMNVRGPRTVRELSELDQLIRRNLGLNPKGGSGSSGGLSIDISILNNAKAANGGSSVVVEAEEIE
jgi:DNA-binding transcriptional regulator LsrR (DeoR family)